MKRALVLAMIAWLAVAALGCSSYRPARVGRKAQGDRFSLTGTACEFGRGAANVGFCWLEIPREIEAAVRENRPGHPFSAIEALFDTAIGAVDGTVWAFERAVGGAFEMVLSPFPPYDPLMEPAYPPYLNFAGGEPGGADD